MAKTYKGWTRSTKEEAIKNNYHFTYWYKEGFPKITDYMDGSPKGWCLPYRRYQVDNVRSKGYERSEYRSFAKLSDAIFYAENGKYSWQV